MAWYDDNSKLSHVVTYKNDKDAAKEANKAANKGWMPQGATATDGHINLGRTAAGTVLTGGLFLLIGGSRTKGKITITYVRTPQWLMEQASRKEEDRIKKEQEKIAKAEEKERRIQEKAKRWG